MKSYLQGMITGGALVFATIIFMGVVHTGEGESGTFIPYPHVKHQIMDTRNGSIFQRHMGTNIKYNDHVWRRKGLSIKQTWQRSEEMAKKNIILRSVPLD